MTLSSVRKSIEILEPFHGDILNRHDGTQTDQGLEITVKGTVPQGATVFVNDIKAQCVDDRFACNVLLTERENVIQARARVGATEVTDAVTVLWDRDSFPRYRFSIDDNIQCLKDLAGHKDVYRSIFDCEYFAFWRRMHDAYGTKAHFNIYYETEGFNLSQMPDKYKAEWQDNADWMRLTFHARRNWPAPDVGLTYEQIEQDYLLVTEEIVRFAGEKLLSPFIALHYSLHGARGPCLALRDHGIRGFASPPVYYPAIPGLRRPKVDAAYYLDERTVRHLQGRDYWKDIQEDLFFIVGDLVVEYLPLDEIVPYLDELGADPHRSEVLEFFTHEQWFWPGLRRPYNPEMTYDDPAIRDKVEVALRWVMDHGYRPVFYEEGFLGVPEP